LLDADNFKSYNDCYGHQAGDEVLQEITRSLVDSIRNADSLYRYGGEELLLLLPETDLEGARTVSNRAREAVAGLRLPHRGSERGIVTISVGVAESRNEDEDDECGWELVIQHADRALYLAKSDGRNCVRALTGEGVAV
jgi:diguanylate cyclase (GGDEF)-like protein